MTSSAINRVTGRSLVRRRASELTTLADRMPYATPPATLPLRIGGLTLGLCTLAIGFFGVLGTWATTATMNSAVVASGLFQVQGSNLQVQHFEGGIVRDIAVAEGDLVQKGQVLARLDETRAMASLSILQNQLASALATEARLKAEFLGAPSLTPSPELTRMMAENPSLSNALQAQIDVFTSGRQLDEGQVQILQDRISQLRQQSTGSTHRAQSLAAQLALVQEDLASIGSLFEEGLATKSRFLAVQRDESALQGDLAVIQTQAQSILQQIAEIEERKLQVRRDHLIDITKERQINSDAIADIRQRIDAAQDVADRLTIRAPRAGRVMDLRINTIGAVVEPGAKVLEIVPDAGNMVIEVKISPADINQVAEGGDARVRLTAFNFRTTPTVTGKVTHVSPDSFVDDRNGQRYFLADIRIDDGQIAALPKVDVLLGMPAQVMISTGEQTLADYLLHPILGGLEVALSESE